MLMLKVTGDPGISVAGIRSEVVRAVISEVAISEVVISEVVNVVAVSPEGANRSLIYLIYVMVKP